MATEQQLENRKKWVEALRSGDYKQTTRELWSDDGYCCLAVAAKVLGDEAVQTRLENFKGMFEDLGAFPEIVGALGLHGSGALFSPEPGTNATRKIPYERNGKPESAISLVNLNDDAGWSFAQIADLIEQQPDLIFKD